MRVEAIIVKTNTDGTDAMLCTVFERVTRVDFRGDTVKFLDKNKSRQEIPTEAVTCILDDDYRE